MIIDEDADSDSDDAAGGAGREDVEGTAYREAITSADGFTRGPNGRIKFNKDTKKRRRENREDGDGDVEMGDADGKAAARPGKRRTEEKLGREFKAKVRHLDSRFSVGNVILMIYSLSRKPEEMSKREMWILMPIFRYHRQQKKEANAVVSASLANDDIRDVHANCSPFCLRFPRFTPSYTSYSVHPVCTSLDLLSHQPSAVQCLVLWRPKKALLPTERLLPLCAERKNFGNYGSHQSRVRPVIAFGHKLQD